MLRVASTSICLVAERVPVTAQKCRIASSLRRRGFSSPRHGPPPAPKRPGYSIPAQGVVFTVMMIPVLAYTLYAGRYGPTDEELEQELRQRYAARVAETSGRSAAMREFFQHTIYEPDGSQDERLKEVLHAGRGDKKRLHAVDEKLYGTEEGAAEKKRQEEERKKREEYRKKKKAGEIVEEEPPKSKNSKSKEAKNAPKSPEAPSNGGLVINTQSAATLGAVALLAAGMGFLAGGSRR